MLRRRSWTPCFPQETLHTLQVPQTPIVQSTAHGVVLHAWSSASVSHASPPYATSCSTLRRRVLVPWPHDVLHALQSPQADSMQSAGHLWVLQRFVSTSAPHGLPPNACAVTMPRRRLLSPPPHDIVHGLHALNTEVTQSTGHGSSLHARACDAKGHTLPGGFCSTLRCCVCVPDPQEREHGVHGEKDDIKQCDEHAPRKHGRSSLSTGQLLPPSDG